MYIICCYQHRHIRTDTIAMKIPFKINETMKIISNNMIRWMNATVTLNHFIHFSCWAGNVLCKLCNWLQLQCLLMAQIFPPPVLCLSISCSSNLNYLNFARWNGLRDFIKDHCFIHLNSLFARHFNYMHATTFFFFFSPFLSLFSSTSFEKKFLKEKNKLPFQTKVSFYKRNASLRAIFNLDFY